MGYGEVSFSAAAAVRFAPKIETLRPGASGVSTKLAELTAPPEKITGIAGFAASEPTTPDDPYNAGVNDVAMMPTVARPAVAVECGIQVPDHCPGVVLVSVTEGSPRGKYAGDEPEVSGVPQSSTTVACSGIGMPAVIWNPPPRLVITGNNCVGVHDDAFTTSTTSTG